MVKDSVGVCMIIIIIMSLPAVGDGRQVFSLVLTSWSGGLLVHMCNIKTTILLFSL